MLLPASQECCCCCRHHCCYILLPLLMSTGPRREEMIDHENIISERATVRVRLSDSAFFENANSFALYAHTHTLFLNVGSHLLLGFFTAAEPSLIHRLDTSCFVHDRLLLPRCINTRSLHCVTAIILVVEQMHRRKASNDEWTEPRFLANPPAMHSR